MDLAGELTLRPSDDGMALLDRRPTGPLRILVGRRVEEAADLLPRIFALCGHAHRNAFERAVAAVTGAVPPDEEAEAREHRECAEAHAWRFAVTWRAAMGLPPDAAGLNAVKNALAGGRMVERVTAMAALTGMTAEIRRKHVDLLRRPLAGEDGVDILGSPPAAWWGQQLDPIAVVPRPDLLILPKGTHDGRVRTLGHLMERLCGAALLAAEGPPKRGRMSAPPSAERLDHGVGIGLAETARGPLCYRVTVRNGCVAEVSAVAPTDWMAHPDGPLAQVIASLPDDDDRESNALLIAALFDPCVPVRHGGTGDA